MLQTVLLPTFWSSPSLLFFWNHIDSSVVPFALPKSQKSVLSRAAMKSTLYCSMVCSKVCQNLSAWPVHEINAVTLALEKSKRMFHPDFADQIKILPTALLVYRVLVRIGSGDLDWEMEVMAMQSHVHVRQEDAAAAHQQAVLFLVHFLVSQTTTLTSTTNITSTSGRQV
jgi:hypothetical protein